MPRTWRVAVIGRTGKGNYGHNLDTVWLNVENVEIVAVADENETGRAAAAKRLSAKTAYADYRQMLAKEKPQIVSVADRFLDQHRDMVLACAEHGANIFLEKPMCRNLTEADEMIAACEKHHVKLAIAHQTRYSPKAARVNEMIQEGKLGDILEVRSRGKEDARGGGEDLMVLGTHLMDLMRFFLGDAKWCHARIWQDGKPPQKGDVREAGEGIGPILGNRIYAVYGFADGVTGSFGTHKAKHGAGKRFALQIYGSKGVVYMQTGLLPLALYCDDPTWLPGRGGQWQEISSNGAGRPETLKDISGLGLGNLWIAKDLIEAIEKDRPPLGSIIDGRAALEMILAVYESFRLDKPVELPLKNRRHPLTMLV
jgi:predicted dehydrogenase